MRTLSRSLICKFNKSDFSFSLNSYNFFCSIYAFIDTIGSFLWVDNEEYRLLRTLFTDECLLWIEVSLLECANI